MLALRRALLIFIAVAGTAMLTLPAVPTAPIALAPVRVEAFPPLPDPESLAALLVSPGGGPGSVVATFSRGETEILLDVVAAIDAIPSPAARASALDDLASLDDLDSSVVAAIARTAERVGLSGARERVIRTVIRRQPHATGGARRAVLDAIRTIGSSGERAALLQLFVTRRGLGERALADVFVQVARLPSSADRSRILVAAARTHRIRGRARVAYVNAMRGLASGRDRSRALAALNSAASDPDAG
jgi:hypothetical protein